MPILKNDSRDRFTVISNSVLEDGRLSWDARGILCYLLSKPTGWQVRIAELQKAGNCGRDKIQRIMRELRAAGYVTDYYGRDPVTGKVCGQTIVVHETPIDVPGKSAEQENNRIPSFPASGESSPLVSTDLVVSTEKKKQDRTASQAMAASVSSTPKTKLGFTATNMVKGCNTAVRTIKQWQKGGTQCPSLAELVVATEAGIQYANSLADDIESRVMNGDVLDVSIFDLDAKQWHKLILEVYRRRYAKSAAFRGRDEITLSFLMGTALADWQEYVCGFEVDVSTSSVLALVAEVGDDGF